MLGVDVGGTFTDVVAVRDGRSPSPRFPASRRTRRGRSWREAAGSGWRAARSSTTPARAASTRSSPAAAEGGVPDHRGPPRHPGQRPALAPADAQTDASWRRPFGDVARPLVPRYLRRGVVERLLADGGVMTGSTRTTPAAARGARALQRRGRRDLPAQRLRQPQPRAAPARADAGGPGRRAGLDLRGDLAAGEGVRARVDDGDRRDDEADLHRYAHELDEQLRELGSPASSTSPTARRRSCRGARRSRSRSGSCSPDRRRGRCRAPGSARRSARAT